MINVLWAIPVSDMGGVARHVRDVFACGVTNCRLTLLVPPGPFAELAETAGHDVIVAPFGPEHGLGSSRRSLQAAAERSGASVVHSHLAYADFVNALTAMGDLARVTTEHGIALDDRVYHASAMKSKIMSTAHRARLRRFDAVIAVSHATARALRAKWHPPRRLPLVVVANGVDRRPAGIASIDSNPHLHVVALSRLAPEKGLLTLLDAFAIVQESHPEARLTIAGDGPLRDEITSRIEKLELVSSVRLAGFVDGIDHLEPVDVVAQLSVWENCSYALLDALIAGCGVVATDVGGNDEILPPRCLVPLGDAQEAASAIVKQASEPSQRPTLRDGWPSVQDMCAALASVYERVAA